MRQECIGILLGCFLVTLPVMAETTPIQPKTSVNPFDTAIMNSPLISKTSYRSQWEADNQPEYSYLYHIEKATTDPTVNLELQKQLKEQLAAAKSVDYGLKNTPSAHLKTLDFKNNANNILSNQSDKIQVKISSDDLEKTKPTNDDVERLKKEAQKASQIKAKHSGINLSDF